MKSWKPTSTVQSLIDQIIRITQPSRLVLFGSRARGTHRENSDVDLCVYNKGCTNDAWNRLLISIQDDPHTLLKIDLVEFETLSEVYQDEIHKDGVLLYEAYA
jgi:predicted nucleotidyltransferase